ncbi:MAG: response regulator [Bacteroidia bacterium]|nr:response regulator [Bacteroidia bacterium]
MAHILFVDDNPRILEMLRRRFEKMDHQVSSANNAEIAENILKKELIDIICLDYMMPDQSGFDFIQDFHQKDRIPVIMMTAHSSMNLAIEFMKAGGADFIEKPIDVEVLHIKINRALHSFQQIRDAQDARDHSEQELRKSNQKLQKRHKELENLYEELDQFTSSVSHELRGPLRQIGMLSQLLEKKGAKCLDNNEKVMLGSIKDSAIRLTHLVNELLSFSKMSQDDMQVKEINTLEMVRTVVNEVLEAHPEQKHEVEIGELPLIEADPVLIRQVFINLIDNALKYSSKKDFSQIEIGCKRGEEEEIFYVKDNGVGFDPKMVDELYKGFRRLHDPDDFDGTGIGLVNVKRIIQRHHGKVWAESKENEGATFYFSLPH